MSGRIPKREAPTQRFPRIKLKTPVTWPLARSCPSAVLRTGFDPSASYGSARTGCRGGHPLGQMPFALSAAASAGVEEIREFQWPFLGLFVLAMQILRPIFNIHLVFNFRAPLKIPAFFVRAKKPRAENRSVWANT